MARCPALPNPLVISPMLRRFKTFPQKNKANDGAD